MNWQNESLQGDERWKTTRPTIITVACIIEVLGVVSALAGSVPHVASGAIRDWRLIWLACSLSASLVSVVAVWKMKRWGVLLYIIGFAFNSGMRSGLGLLIDWTAITGPLAWIAVGLLYFKRMKWY